jgi:SAM-dependent methyltransferase
MYKKTIVQIESFYPQLLQEAYGAFPGLRGLPFERQIAHLLATGFSGGHNVVPFLNPSQWDGHYIVLNCPWSQQRWAEEHGLPVGIGGRDLLLAQLRHLQPDVLYLSDIPGFDFTLLDELPSRPAVVGWHATTVSAQTPWSAFDLVLSGIQGIRDEVLARGARAAADFMPAAPAHVQLGRSAPWQPGVVFSGSFYGGIHQERARQFRLLSRALGDAGMDIHTPQPFAIDLEDRIRFHPAVYGHDVIRLYARHGMVLDSRGDFNLGDGGRARDSSNMRIFEATRAGSLLFTENSPNLPRYFEPGLELETYSSFDELVSKLKFYGHPDNEAARRKIAEAGLRRVRQSHLVEHRAAWLEDLLGQHLGRQRVAPIRGNDADEGAVEEDEAGTAVLLSATRSSLVFTLAQAEQVRAQWPQAACHVLCMDQVSQTVLKDTAPGLHRLVPPADGADWTPGDDLAPALRLARELVHAHPTLERVVSMGSDLAFQGLAMETLDAAPIAMGAWRFGEHLQHAKEQLGAWAPSLWSASRVVLTSGWLAALLDAPNGQALSAADFHDAATRAGILVQAIDVLTPWAGAAPSVNAVSHIGPLSFVELARWQFMPYESAPNWQAWLQQLYVPQLQRLQALYSRLPVLALQGDQYLRPSSPAMSDYLARHELRTRGGYRLLSAGEYSGFATEISGWDVPSVAAIQHESFRQLLDAFKAGRQRADMRALTRIFGRIAQSGTTVLEEGCGSGYNSELIRLAAGPEVKYSGIDIAHSMVDLARKSYPGDQFEVMPSEHLKFEDASFDVVLNGASLMHTIDYEQALAEARRVARQHVVLHTVTVAETEQHVHFEKNAYGSRVPEVCFSAKGLDEMLARHRLLPVQMEDSINYDLLPTVGVPSRSVSLACYCLPEAPARPNHYCTYFDSNYLPRGVLMIRSLLRHDPTAVVHVLCLDDTCAKALAALDLPLQLVPLPELLQADPEFAASRDNRSLVEWYFTATSCLVNLLVKRHPDIERVIYLDSDLYFYASPQVLIDEAKDASVQIIEHRFSPQWAQLVAFGRFNVGWIAFTTTEEGLRLIADYRAKCLEWCYDRMEGDRFGDQKYLDKWPQDYPSCCVSQLQGANVAWWNLANGQPRTLGDRVFFGPDLLLFFHFQEIKRQEDGCYRTKKDPAEYGAYHELVYAPYMAELTQVDEEVRPLIDGFKIKDIRYQSW